MTMAKPKVAIITRTKDRARFLERAITSIASQTYKDYRHVILNDGGDATIIDAKIDSLPNEIKSKIVVKHRDSSSGAPDTIFNEAIAIVDSDYVAIHDDDDTWHAQFLEKTVAELDKKPELGAVVVRADKVIETEELAVVKTMHFMADMKAVNLYRQCIDNQLTPIATLLRRSAYEKVGKFDDSLPICGDWELGIRLLMSYDVGYIDPGYALANYHHRKTSRADNSFAAHDHLYYVNLIMNRYLRKELTEGKLGPGYIMSKLKYDQTTLSERLKRLLPRSIVSIMKNRVRE